MNFLTRKKQVEFLGSEYQLGLIEKKKTFSYTCDCGQEVKRSIACNKVVCFNCRQEKHKTRNRSTSMRNVQNYLKRKFSTGK
jgi:predicted SprT family Zn-dependent metalloprotease